MNLKKQFFKYVSPSIIAMWVFSIYTIVDGFFVANFAGTKELSAVTIVIPFVNFLFAIAIIFSVGSQTIIGIFLGQKKKDDANKIFTFILIFILIFSVILAMFAMIFIDELILFLGATSNLFSLAKDYLKIIIIFSPFYIISYCFEVLVKVDGYPRTAIIGAVSACLTNIFLDFLLIEIFKLGVKGAALATGIAQALSVIIFLIHFRRGSGYLRFDKIKMTGKEIFNTLKKIISFGFGEFIAEFNTATVVFIFNTFIMKYLTPEFLSSYAVINYMSILANSTFQGVCHGTLPLLSFYHGSRETKKSRTIIKYGFISIFVISIIFFSISFFGAKTLLNAFLENEDRTLSSIRPMRAYALMFFFAGHNVFIASIASAIGKPKYSTTINIMRGTVVLVLSLYFVVHVLGVRYLFYGAALCELITLITSIYFLRIMNKPATI